MASATARTAQVTLTPAEIRAEWAACQMDPAYFLDRYGHVYDAADREWLPFHLWDAQLDALDFIDLTQLAAILKARQLGLTWLMLGFILWQMIFWPACTALLFSKREEEAVYLLGEERLRGMYRRLPAWMKSGVAKPDGATAWRLMNGSVARAFPSNAGDSYTASIALVDEADLVPDLDRLLSRVKPTIDAGGKLILLSRADKSQPESPFKRVYRAARAGNSPWRCFFLPWKSRPDRDEAWYEAKRADVFSRTGSLDELHEQYPATDAEALSPRTLDKRIPAAWLEAVYVPRDPLTLPAGAPSVPGLEVYNLPLPSRRYVCGADPAEGNPTSDDSAACVLEAETGEEVATFAGRHEPGAFANYVKALCLWFNRAPVLVERNNHGHAVLLALKSLGGVRRLEGADGREGWLSSTLGNAALYDRCADAVRNGEVILHSLGTFTQLASIDGNTLSAPGGSHDDRADAFALSNVGRPKARRLTLEAPSLDARTAADKLPSGVFG